jgi:hypothetical protein
LIDDRLPQIGEFAKIQQEEHAMNLTGVYDDSELSDEELAAIAAQTIADLDSVGPIE